MDVRRGRLAWHLHALKDGIQRRIIVRKVFGAFDRRLCSEALQHSTHARLHSWVLHHDFHLLHHERILHHLHGLLKHCWVLHRVRHGAWRRDAATVALGGMADGTHAEHYHE